MKEKLITVCGAVLILCSFLDRPSLVWGEYPQVQGLGGLIAGKLGCASPPDGSEDVTCAVKDTNTGLYGIRFNPRTNYTSGYIFLGVSGVASTPSCTYTANSYQHGEITCAFVGSNGLLQGVRFNPRSRPPTVTKVLSFRDKIVSGDPSCVDSFDNADSTTCVVKDSVGALLAIQFNPRTTFRTPYQALGLRSLGNPRCGRVNNGISCAWRGGRNELYAINFYPGTNPPKQQYLGGIIVGDPSCSPSVFDPADALVCGVKGLANGLFGIRFNPATGFTTGFQSLGGVLADHPGCSGASFSHVFCAVKDTGNTLWDIDWDVAVNRPIIRRGLRSWGKYIMDDPVCTAVTETGKVTCAFKGANNELYGVALTVGQ